MWLWIRLIFNCTYIYIHLLCVSFYSFTKMSCSVDAHFRHDTTSNCKVSLSLSNLMSFGYFKCRKFLGNSNVLATLLLKNLNYGACFGNAQIQRSTRQTLVYIRIIKYLVSLNYQLHILLGRIEQTSFLVNNEKSVV